MSVKRPSRSSAAAKATEWTSRSSPPPKVSPTSAKTRCHVVVRAHVALGDERARRRSRPARGRCLLDPLALVGEREPGALVGEPLRDRPGDRALVRDAEDEPGLPLEAACHGGESSCGRAASATLRVLAPPTRLPRRCRRGARLCASRRSAALRPIRRGTRRGHARRESAPGTSRSRRDSRRPRPRDRAPRAAAARRARGLRRALGSRSDARRLDVSSSASRAYLARIERRPGGARSRSSDAAIPEARVGRRYSDPPQRLRPSTCPRRRLPELVRQPFVSGVYPSLRYTPEAERQPRPDRRPALAAATGARGDGVKIGIVDDGIDQRERLLQPGRLRLSRRVPERADRAGRPRR